MRGVQGSSLLYRSNIARLKVTSQIVGFGGYAFAGKDASADILVDLGWKKTYMSKPLHEALRRLNPLIYIDPLIETSNKPHVPWEKWDSQHVRFTALEHQIGYDDAKKYPEVRRLLQVLGTEVGREIFGTNVWSDLMKREVVGYLRDGHSVAVTGIRFVNELQAIWSMGGVNIWVERPGYGPVNSHTSDNALRQSAFDDVIVNDGDLGALRTMVCALLDRLELGVYQP